MYVVFTFLLVTMEQNDTDDSVSVQIKGGNNCMQVKLHINIIQS